MKGVFPDLERPLADHLTAATGFRWVNEGGHTTAVPRGIVQQVPGSNSLDLEATPSFELTIQAAGGRQALRAIARKVVAALAHLNPGGLGDSIYIDEASLVFDFAIDPDRGTADYRVATATLDLTLRPQGEL